MLKNRLIPPLKWEKGVFHLLLRQVLNVTKGRFTSYFFNIYYTSKFPRMASLSNTKSERHIRFKRFWNTEVSMRFSSTCPRSVIIRPILLFFKLKTVKPVSNSGVFFWMPFFNDRTVNEDSEFNSVMWNDNCLNQASSIFKDLQDSRIFRSIDAPRSTVVTYKDYRNIYWNFIKPLLSGWGSKTRKKTENWIALDPL